jgi:preprotein translocase subunit SecA
MAGAEGLDLSRLFPGGLPEAALRPAAAMPGPAPLSRLFLLEGHRAADPLPWLDRAGHRVLSVARDLLRRPVPALRRRAMRVLAAAEPLLALEEAALREEMVARAAIARAAPEATAALVDRCLPGSIAAVHRITGLRPHPEQVMGALLLAQGGGIAEMATGEGKTLTIAIATAVAAWRGRPCHVVTANDYLAKRDAELFTAFYALCGLSVSAVIGETPLGSRAAAYSHDVVYTTAKELLGDFLRDSLALGRQPSPVGLALGALGGTGEGGLQAVMRGLFQVIVDEADSVLIDEAVTPLIISSPRPDGSLDAAAKDAVRLAAQLEKHRDFTLTPALRHVELTAAGKDRLAALTGSLSAFWQSPQRAQELVVQALYARHLLVRDQHYVVREGKIVLVDELTGRLADQRTLSVGLQQVLDATEGLEVSAPTEVSARLSFQRFFRLFPHLGGTTGTAREARPELASVYRLRIVGIPTHRKVRRRHAPLRLLPSEAAKFDAVAAEALRLAREGRAVLVGIRTVRAGEALLRRFRALDAEAAREIQLLHAVNHANESAIVAEAGRPGAITIATNMAGRGTDIALDPAVKQAGGLHVIIGEPNDYRRIDRQLVGRCARQGDPGSVQMFVSFEDDVVRRFLPPALLTGWRRLHAASPALARQAAPALLGLAQRRAERLSASQRARILKQDLQHDKAGF